MAADILLGLGLAEEVGVQVVDIVELLEAEAVVVAAFEDSGNSAVVVGEAVADVVVVGNLHTLTQVIDSLGEPSPIVGAHGTGESSLGHMDFLVVALNCLWPFQDSFLAMEVGERSFQASVQGLATALLRGEARDYCKNVSFIENCLG